MQWKGLTKAERRNLEIACRCYPAPLALTSLDSIAAPEELEREEEMVWRSLHSRRFVSLRYERGDVYATATEQGLRAHYGWFAMQVWAREAEPYPMTTGAAAVAYYLLGWLWPLVILLCVLMGARFLFTIW